MSDLFVYDDAELVRVKDGDTFVARVSRDFGYHITTSSVQNYRLNGCAAAPLKTLSGAGASGRVHDLLWQRPFRLTSLGPYKYGDEWMADVTLADGRSLAAVLIAEQWAVPWTGKGSQPLPPWPRTVP